MNQDPLAGFPLAKPWSLNTGHAGQVLVFAGLFLFLVAAILSAVSAKDRPGMGKFAGWSFGLGSLSLFGAFGCLAALFANDQFQFNYVFSHGDVHTSLQYKIAGVWSGQQGSFLLWACCSAIFGLLTMRGAGKYRPGYLGFYSVFLATLCGILAYETPFGLIQEVVRGSQVFIPPSGQGLAPSLMNYWVVIHPPTIFMGFGSLTVLFAYAVAAILHRDLTSWAGQVRPWSLVSTAVLGLGICMGGFWAYETLGWGGFWGWDPVENASFIPWLFVVTFVHGLIVQAGKKRWHGTNLILGALPFLTFCYGTFLTRGGFLDKVSNHSFASMNKSALVILEYFLATIVIGFTGLYLWKGRSQAKALDVKQEASGVSRESLYGTGVLFVSLLAVVLILGMSWPVIMGLMQRSVSKVEEGLYHLVVVWFFIPIIVVMAITPFVGWRPQSVKEILTRVANVFCVAVGITGIVLLGLKFPDWGTPASASNRVTMPFGIHVPAVPWVGLLLLLCVFTFVANLWRAVEMFRVSKQSVGGFVAHLGLATLLAGLIVSRGLEQQEHVLARSGRPVQLLGYTLTPGQPQGKTLFDRDGTLPIDVKTPSGTTFTATPGLYYQQPEDASSLPKPMVWPYVRRYAAHDFYLSLGAPILTVWEKPEVFHVGETKTLQGITVKYQGMDIQGTPGTPSASFGARLLVTPEGGSTHEVLPTFGVRDGAQFALIDQDLQIVMPRMDAADKSVELQVYFRAPVYPIEVFTKPFTGLVWGGTGILTLGGLMAAFSRRQRKKATARQPETEVEPVRTDQPVPAT